MPFVICDKTTLKIREDGRWSVPPARAGEIAFEVASEPQGDERWNGDEVTPALRAPTAQELSNDAVAEKNTKSASDLGTALNKTLRDLLLDIEQRLRAAGQTSNIQDIADASNQTEYLQALRKIHEGYQ